MASYSKKTRKTDPSYRRNRSNALDTQLQVPLIAGTLGGTTPIYTIDAPRIASMYNHRLYRQCGTYRLKVDLKDSAYTGGVKVVTLANTWYVKRSIQTARDMHDLAVAEERGVSKQARWYDFRIQNGSSIDGVSNDMLIAATTLPQNAIAAVPFAGEWDYSQITNAAGNTMAFSLSGATSASQYNIFTEYDDLDNADASPVSSPTGGYDDVTAEINSENITRLLNKGNNPPYDSTNLPGQVFVQVADLYRTPTGTQRLSTGYFEAPLGLVWLYTFDGAANQVAPDVILEFQKGTYKGVRMEAY